MAPPRTGTGSTAKANPSARATTERASRASAGGIGAGGAFWIDMSTGSVYLAIVPCRDSINKRWSVRPFRDRVYSGA